MFKQILFSFIVLLSFATTAQEKVTWSYLYHGGDDAIYLQADIAEGWHLYSQHIDNEIGPVPTSFRFKENKAVTYIGDVLEPESIKEYDPNFEGELNFFKEQVVFTQKVKVSQPTTVMGVVTYMVCNDTMCLPPRDEIFTIIIQ